MLDMVTAVTNVMSKESNVIEVSGGTCIRSPRLGTITGSSIRSHEKHIPPLTPPIPHLEVAAPCTEVGDNHETTHMHTCPALLTASWGRVFGVHGGISPNLKTLAEVCACT